MSIWAEDEVQTADLEDRCLNKRLAWLLERLGEHPQLSIPAACGGWKETMGAYQFFDNDKAPFKQILAPHRDATVERMKGSPVVLPGARLDGVRRKHLLETQRSRRVERADQARMPTASDHRFYAVAHLLRCRQGGVLGA